MIEIVSSADDHLRRLTARRVARRHSDKAGGGALQCRPYEGLVDFCWTNSAHMKTFGWQTVAQKRFA